LAFTYDDWNVIEEREYNANGELTHHLRHTWGADVSGSLQGAGGVGGLVMSEELDRTGNSNPPVPHYFWYDGNGNVTGIVDGAGSVEATYRYTSFGAMAESSTSTSFAQRNAMKFSTKYHDPEVEPIAGTYYYGYRHYLPSTGRWPSRDPIGEEGGLNLYGMAYNDILNSVEFLGLEPAAPDCCETERRRVREAQAALDAATANQTAAQTAHQDALAREAAAKQAVDEAKGTLRGLQQEFVILSGIAVASAVAARATCLLASVTPPPHRFIAMAGCWAARAGAVLAAAAAAQKAAQIGAQHGVIQNRMADHNAAIAARRAAKGNLDAANAQVNAATFSLQLAVAAAANCIPAPECYCTPLL